MKKTYWIWELIVFLLLLGACFLASGDLSIYIDGVSILFILILPLFILFMAYSPREMVNHFKVARKAKGADLDKVQSGLEFFERYQKILILSIIISFFGSGVAMLRMGFGAKNGSDLEMIGRSLGTMLISVVYGLSMIIFITLPRIGALKKKLAEKD